MSHRSLVLGLSVLAGLVALPGCVIAPAGEGDGAEPVAAAGQPIMGGASDASDLAVVDIIWQTSSGISECSGSLLAPNMVLTAHHCVSNLVNSQGGGVDCTITSFAAPDVPTNFFVSTKEFLTSNAADFHTVHQVVTPPATASAKLCGIDQAILILNDNIAPSEAVPLVPRVDVPVAAKDPYSAIGFGITADSANDSGTRRRLNNLVVDCAGAACSAIYGNQINTTHEFVGDHGTCEGDSGGPALDPLNRVFGVTSRGGAGCSSPVYGDVYSWASWIKATAQTAATFGKYTAPPWVTGWPTDPAYSYPVGGACGSTTTCPSNICLDDDAGSYCSRLCEDAAPCPTGYTCDTVQNLQICQRTPPAVTPTPTGTTGAKSGCSVQSADPTKPVPWFMGLGLFALALLRRRRAVALREAPKPPAPLG